MKLQLGKRYRARNGQLFTLEKMHTSYFTNRIEGQAYPFCAQHGLFTWQEDGAYGLIDCSVSHPLDLVEEIPESYNLTKLESLSEELSNEKLAIEKKELEETVVLRIPKWQLMFLIGLVGNTNPAESFQRVLGSYSKELLEDAHWRAFVQSLQPLSSHEVFGELLKWLEACDDSRK